jgi:hypothetical protein
MRKMRATGHKGTIEDAQIHPKQWKRRDSRAPAQQQLGGTPPRATAISHNEPPDDRSTLKSQRGLLEGTMAGCQAASRGF